MGTPIPGTVIAAKVTTGNTDNTFAIADANEIQGGHHSVATLADRDAIPADRRVEGMTCWVVASGTTAVYRLVGGIANVNWVADASGGNADAAIALANQGITQSWAGTNAIVLANQGITQSWAGTNAIVLANQALQTAWLGTNATSATNLAYTALQTAWTGTAEAAAAIVLANQGVTQSWAGTNAISLANTAFTTSWAGTNAITLANQALVLAQQGTSSVMAVVNGGSTGLSLVGATTAGTVAMNSLAAGAGISLAAGANSVLISSGTSAEIGYEDAMALEVFQDYSVGTLPTLNRGIGWDGPAYGLGHSIAVATGVNGQQTKRLVLTQGEYARKFAWGSQWAKLRLSVGVRFNGTTAPVNPQIYIGICSGTARPYTAANTLDWIGGGYDGPAVYLATTTPLVGVTYSPFYSKRYGVLTGYGQGAGSAGRCFCSTGSLVSVLMAEIIRTTYTGTQNYSISIQSPTTTKVALNASYSTLLHTGRLHDINAATFGDSAGYVAAPYNDAAGPHDALSFVYTGAVPLEVAYICATRVY